MEWQDEGNRFPTYKAMIGDLQYSVSGQSYGGTKWWWYVEVGSDDAGQKDFADFVKAMKAAEEFSTKLQAFLDSLKEE